MDPRDETLLRVGVAAALADGTCDARERPHLDDLARAAGVESGTALSQDVTLPFDLAARLGTPEASQAAYDLAVAVGDETRTAGALAGAAIAGHHGGHPGAAAPGLSHRTAPRAAA